MRICNHFTATEAVKEKKKIGPFLLLSREFPLSGRTFRRLSPRGGKSVFELLHIDPFPLEADSFGLEPKTLFQRRFPAQRNVAAGTQNPLPGKSAHQAQYPGYLAGMAGKSSSFGDGAVGTDTAPGYLPDGGGHRGNHGLLISGWSGHLPAYDIIFPDMTEADRNPLQRFSDRAEDYARYRPHYSHDVVHAVQETCGLRPEHLIADIGCGPGMLAEIFLDNGNRVTGVEPNLEMRVAGEKYLAGRPYFRAVDGSAEATNLEPSSVDFVVAGQAFHWFRPPEARIEFARILKPGGWAVLVWHDRDIESTAFLKAYEAFIRRHAIDYEQVTHKYLASYDALQRFFAPNELKLIKQHNQQQLDFDGLRGRLLSSSYIPKSGERYQAMLKELPELFSAHASDGHVALEYDTKIYCGHLER